MKKLSLIISSIITLVSLTSCGSSNNYLSQNYSSSTSKSHLIAVQAMLEKPNNVPQPIDFTLNQPNEVDVIEKLESASFISSLDLSIQNIIFEANSYLGTPYRWGGTTRRGIDCSAFMQKIYRVAGINLPRVSINQAKIGVAIDKDELQKGDLVFFSTTSPRRVTHVGMVIDVNKDDIKFIHAASSKGVSIASLSSAYWGRKYRSARRPNKFLFDTLVSNKEVKKTLASNP